MVGARTVIKYVSLCLSVVVLCVSLYVAGRVSANADRVNDLAQGIEYTKLAYDDLSRPRVETKLDAVPTSANSIASRFPTENLGKDRLSIDSAPYPNEDAHIVETYISTKVFKLTHPDAHTWYAGQDGVFRHPDGYIVAFAPSSVYDEDTIIDTSLGQARVTRYGYLTTTQHPDTGEVYPMVELVTNW